MPAIVERLKLRLKGGLTLSGIGRVYRDIALEPRNFQGLETHTASAYGTTPGSAAGGSILLPIGSSALSWVSGSLIKIQTIVASGASTASPTTAVTYVPKPTDADTSGSIICYVDFTYGDAPATTGSKVTMFAGAGYVTTGCTAPRTGASVGAASAASYTSTASGEIATACLGKFPSFGANDIGIAFGLAWGGASAAGDQGKLTAACVHILGVRLRYLACALGIQSTE